VIEQAIRQIKWFLSQQRPLQALQTANHSLQMEKNNPELLLLRAQALLASERSKEAVEAFRSAIDAAPDRGIAELGLAVALGQSGQAAAAEKAARNAIAKQFDNAGSRFVLAKSLFDQGRYVEAEAGFRHVLEVDAQHSGAAVSLVESVWMRTGDAEAALTLLKSIDVQSVDMVLLRAKLRSTTGDSRAELSELESTLAKFPTNVALRTAAARAAILHDASRALHHAVVAVETAPHDRSAYSSYGDALLAMGHAEQASKVASRLLESNPHDGHAIALQTSAWRMLDDSRYHQVCDYSRVVSAQCIDTPDGWDDLPAYLRDLASSLRQLHQLRAHPLSQTLRRGTQVELYPEHAEAPALRAFPQAIDRPIRRHLQHLGQGEDVLRRRNTGDYRFNGMWSVQLRSSGYHFNHFHGKGWLSSACYIHLAENMGATGGEGWLQFGEPVMPTMPPLRPDYFVKPEPGLLVLFPAWMWHGTTPFTGDNNATRLTIAFDIVPA
jgi:tetratricopeptide (TPR) repeat protein